MDWNVERSPRKCARCGAEFPEGQEYYSALIDSGTAFERRDHCATCWENAPDRLAAFSRWKTRVPKTEEEHRLLAADDVLWEFFLRLQDDPDAARQQFCYLLALILMRRKLLKLDDVERDSGREFLILRQPKQGRRFRVANPQLTENQLEQVKEQMGQILNMSL